MNLLTEAGGGTVIEVDPLIQAYSGMISDGANLDLPALQALNPIKVGSYLGVIYWDGKGDLPSGSLAGFFIKDHLDDTGHTRAYWVENYGQGPGLAFKTASSNSVEIGRKAGFYVIDGYLDAFEQNTVAYKDSILYHSAALQLRPARVGDDIEKFYWDGTYLDYKNGGKIYTFTEGITRVDQGDYDNITCDAGQFRYWKTGVGVASTWTASGVHSIPSGFSNHVYSILQADGSAPILWVYDSAYADSSSRGGS